MACRRSTRQLSGQQQLSALPAACWPLLSALCSASIINGISDLMTAHRFPLITFVGLWATPATIKGNCVPDWETHKSEAASAQAAGLAPSSSRTKPAVSQ
eukprot:scaffold41460_cov21-Prasinocladus_malaysianus.AAC.1